MRVLARDDNRSQAAVVRNTGLNLAGQVMPAAAAVVCVPTILSHYGLARFGILSLAWVILANLTMFDLGLGRATTKFVAEAVGLGDRASVRPILWTSLSIQVTVGAVAAVALVFAVPFAVGRFVKMPSGLLADAEAVGRILAFSVPVVICTLSLRGVLEAHQRFGLINIVRSVSNSALFIVPAIGASLGWALPPTVALLVGALLLTGIGYLAIAVATIPELRAWPVWELRRLRTLLGFGGWVTVSALLVPLLLYADRLLLSALRSVSALGIYTVPFELASRMQVVPSSLATAFFPAASAAAAARPEAVTVLFRDSVRHLFVVMALLSVGLVAAANPLLTVWISAGFARQATLPLQLIALGVLVNALSQVAAHAIDAVGRPDLRAKVFLVYTAPYIAIAWFSILQWGIVGAAGATLVRAVIEFAIMFAVAISVLGQSVGGAREPWTARAVAIVTVFAAPAFVLGQQGGSVTWLRGAMTLALVLSLALLMWRFLVDDRDRRLLRGLLVPSAWVRAA